MISDTVRELTRDEYNLFRDLIYEKCGINLGDQKMQLVRARLGKRLRNGSFSSYREYYECVKADQSGRELTELIDAISTNTTHLFRENQHFDFLRDTVTRWMQENRPGRNGVLRIWSAGCSSGDEPYSLVMTMDDLVRQHTGLKFKILATDISTKMLEAAQAGIFTRERMVNVPPEYKQRYFQKVGAGNDDRMQILPGLRQQIKFARLNLMDAQFPFRNGFDIIFCRNVMIYFDRATQEKLVAKYARVMTPGGYLLIGHSESLNNITHGFTYVMPTIYRKP